MDAPSAILPAAGHSSRMGELKPLADLGGRSLLARAVETFVSIGVVDVVVVTGHRSDEVAATAEALGARPVSNLRFDAGMYSSVQAGAAAVEEGRRFFLLPGDHPLVRPETAGWLARAGASAGAHVMLPEFAGLAGYPPAARPVPARGDPRRRAGQRIAGVAHQQAASYHACPRG